MIEAGTNSGSKKFQTGKGELERTLLAGMHGPPELKRAEKRRHLGEFRERVMVLLTKKQVMEPGVYPEVVRALEDKQASGVLLNGEISFNHTAKYEKLAADMGKKSTIVHDPDFKGQAGLEVVSDQAVDVADIKVRGREERLKELGMSEKLIRCAGKKVCTNCYGTITEADSREAINYRKMTSGDYFWGERCPGCKTI
ncbi:MAG: YueI family protein [Firmicutes bacterium]|nr:YueI family protein [Bacillota bacterium]